MAYQPKSYRKFLAGTVSAAVVASAVAPVAAASFTDVPADNVHADDINTLVEKGYIKGYPDGTFKPNNSLTRGEAAIIFARILKDKGVEVPADKNAFPDVPADHPNTELVEALAIVKAAGVMTGDEKGNFNPNAKITREQMAKVVVEAFKLTKPADFTTKVTDLEKASAWAREYIQILDANGVTKNTEFMPKANVTRGQFASFVVRSLNVEKEVALEVESLKATGAKKLEVKFNKAVDDTKAKFEVKKGSVTANISKVSFTEDKKTAVIELSTKLTKGDYTVTVTGVADKEFVKTVTVEDEKVAKIEILSDKAAKTATGATVAYRVLNQYDEDITSSSSTPEITWTASSGTATDDNKGKVTLTGSYTTGDTVTLTGVEKSSGTVVTKTLTIGTASAADEVKVVQLYHPENKELNTSSDFSEFYLLVEAKDQYGNKVDATQFNNDVIVSSSNPAVLDVDKAYDNKGPKSDMIGIKLKKPASNIAGTVTLRFISKLTGKVSTFDVTVKEAVKVDKITLSNPTTVVAAGETVEIPFEAIDQYGNAVTSYSDLNGKVTLISSAGTLGFVNDYVNKKAVLKFTAPNTKGTYVLTAVTPTGKSSQITVEVKDAATPAVVSGLKDVATNLLFVSSTADSASVTVKPSNLVVQDQYGRDYKLDSTFFSNYKLKLEVADGTAENVKINGGSSATITSTSDTVTLTAAAKGSENIKVSILKSDNSLVAGSEYDFNVNVVDKSAIVDYVVEDIPTIYDDQAPNAYTKELKVYGKKSDGSKVVIPSGLYTVTTTLSGLTYANGKLDANTVFTSNDSATVTEKTGKVIVVINGKDGAVTVQKDVKVSRVAPKVEKITLEATGNIEVNNGVVSAPAAYIDTVSELLAAVKFEDQYGETLTLGSALLPNNAVSLTFTAVDDTTPKTLSLTNGPVGTAAINNLSQGDNFSVTVVTTSGQVLTFKVVAE